MAIVSTPLRAVWFRTFAAAVVLAAVVGTSAVQGADFRAVADPCTQATTNGSTSLQCGTRGVGGPDYSGGCMNAYGGYQNCTAQVFGPPSIRR